jgi:hypothetical protein
VGESICCDTYKTITGTTGNGGVFTEEWLVCTTVNYSIKKVFIIIAGW